MNGPGTGQVIERQIGSKPASRIDRCLIAGHRSGGFVGTTAATAPPLLLSGAATGFGTRGFGGKSVFDSGTQVDSSQVDHSTAHERDAEGNAYGHIAREHTLREKLTLFKTRLMTSAGTLPLSGTLAGAFIHGERANYLRAAGGMAVLSLGLLGLGLGALIAPHTKTEPVVLAADATPRLLVETLSPPASAASRQTAAVAKPADAEKAETPADEMTVASLPPADDQLTGEEAAPVQAEAAAPVSPEEVTHTVKLGSGDTLMGILTDEGASRDDAHMAIAALRSHYDPRKLRAGQELSLTFEEWPRETDLTAHEDEEAPQNTLLSVAIKTDVDRHVEVMRAADGTYKGEEVLAELTKGRVQARATIDSSLFLAAAEAGIPPAITVELIRMYSYSVDFQREIRVGDSFEVFFERDYDENGAPVREGDVLYASMTVGGKTHKLWRYDPGDGNWDYFDENGQSMKKFLMKTPIDGARISSNFGKRRHPILGYTKLHSGTDFAAPTGTPIYAAGDGTVEMSRRYGGYGNYVRLRHANGYQTAYAHMNGFARGIREGRRVKQGQVIGYVGTTGRSTGPHLHYEVIVNGKKVNPRTIRVPTGRKLAKNELSQFKLAQADINRQMAAAPDLTKIAKAEIAAED